MATRWTLWWQFRFGRKACSRSHRDTTELPSSAHRQIHMRTDKEPFNDKRVRQAMALLVDRRALVDGLLARIRLRPTTARSPRSTGRRRRSKAKRDVAKAKELLAAAGKEDASACSCLTWHGFEMPRPRQLISRTSGRPESPHLSITPTPPRTTASNVRQLALAGLDDGDHRLRTRGVPNVLSAHRSTARHLEQRPLQERPLRPAGQGLRRSFDPRRAAPLGQIRSRSFCSTKCQSCSPYFSITFLSGAKDYVAGVETTPWDIRDVSRAGLT